VKQQTAIHSWIRRIENNFAGMEWTRRWGDYSCHRINCDVGLGTLFTRGSI